MYSEPWHIQTPVYYRKFRHIKGYSRPILTYSTILRHILNSYAEPYLEPDIYSELCQDIFWHIQNAV